MKRKAQMRMMETIAVIFIFFILVLFGLIFFTQIQSSAFEERQAEAVAEQSISISLQAIFFPELQCSKGEGIPVRDCIDLFKLEAAQQKMQAEQDYYFDIFQFATITVQEIYPGSRTWVLYNQTKEDATRRIRTPVPVSLFEPVQNDFRYGVLTIEVQS